MNSIFLLSVTYEQSMVIHHRPPQFKFKEMFTAHATNAFKTGARFLRVRAHAVCDSF
jgi:hypothetical protein